MKAEAHFRVMRVVVRGGDLPRQPAPGLVPRPTRFSGLAFIGMLLDAQYGTRRSTDGRSRAISN